jgi:polyisoprenoid-binding protein YceI
MVQSSLFQPTGDIMIRRLAAAAVALPLVIIAGGVAAQETYMLDPVHSQPSYEIKHMMGLSTQRGSFMKSAGKVTIDRSAKKGTVDVTIDTASLRTHNTAVDDIMKGEQYFNVVKYPTMTFKSSDLIFDGDRVVGADGELTMLGVTKPVRLKVDNFSCGDNPFNKKPMCAAEITATIKRSEWGMTTGIPRSSSDEVRIVIPVEAYKE